MFFDIFYDLCKQKGVSCKKAAEEMGLSNSITTKWKKTGATPSGETLDKVALYFGVSTDYLLGKRYDSMTDLFMGNSSRPLTPMEAQIAAQAQKRQLASSGGLSEDKRAMYDFIDALSDEQVKRLLQIARAAF